MSRRALTIGSHVVLTALGYLAAFVLSSEFELSAATQERFAATVLYLIAVRLAFAHGFRIDRGFWRHIGVRDVTRLTAAIVLGAILFPIVLLAVGELHGIPASVFVLEAILTTALTGGVRIAARILHEREQQNSARGGKRTLVVGAGEAGEQLIRQILHDGRHRFQVVGLIDDDPVKRGRSLHGVPVLGTPDELRGLVELHRVSLALIAIPSATTDQLRRLVDRCVEAGVEVKLLPPFKDLVTSDIEVSQVRHVRIEDLLGRETVELDLDIIEPELAGKVILVTGAAGSIGSELARQIARFHPVQLVLIDRAESPLYFVHRELSEKHPEIDVVPVLASVTNSGRMQKVFEAHRPDCVFHAAAYKHVPLLEMHVVEGVWNNVIGTMRIARIAARSGARKFVLISTDKAVNPTSILGATKLLAERVVLELPSLRSSGTDIRVVRFGNVLGSDGSVLPLFRRQLEAGGPLTVTHPEVRRYFMTIPEAAQLVLQAAALPEARRRIALLEMGTQVKILDLAEQLIRLAGLTPGRDVKIAFTGLRPGEKLYEELVAPGETAVPSSADKIRIVEPNGSEVDALARRLRRLIRVTTERDEGAIVRALSTLVPEYQPPQSAAAIHTNGSSPSHRGNGRSHTRPANGNGNGSRHTTQQRAGTLMLTVPDLPGLRAIDGST